ncbi:hypothetical protein CDD83_8644 [Cordyceps sp. RAO-2017]|nr:hypothetical protein CDD83_8644 [Cordyceps sp. RAO-2017]
MSRSEYSATRACGGSSAAPALACPLSGSRTVLSNGVNGTQDWKPMSSTNYSVPSILREIYSSGAQGEKTVSNFLDIEWRRQEGREDERENAGFRIPIGTYSSLPSMALNNALDVVEGLVVDTITGGIGFRNHTIPHGFDRRVSWQEDLLFVVPETVCVDTNLTIAMSISEGRVTRAQFTGYNETVESVLRQQPQTNFEDGQKDAQLPGRARAAAWWHNALASAYFDDGIARQRQHTFNRVSPTTLSYMKNWDIPDLSPITGNNGTLDIFDYSISTSFSDHIISGYMHPEGMWIEHYKIAQQDIPNSYNVSPSNFTIIHNICSGVTGATAANGDNILVGCGLMRGAPQFNYSRHGSKVDGWKLDAGKIPRNEYFSFGEWSQKVYTCASAVKATIKTVFLSYDGRDNGLKGLKVNAIKEKEYPDISSMPLWGIEDVVGYSLDEIRLLWGLVGSEYERKPNITTYRQPSIYLKGRMEPNPRQTHLGIRQSLAGTDFASQMLSATYCDTHRNRSRPAFSEFPYPDLCRDFDYRGRQSLGMFLWTRNLTANPESASRFLNLIATDVAASMLVGTKGLMSKGSQEPYTVVQEVPRLRYHLPYAVPAVGLAFVVLLTVHLALVLFWSGRGGFSGLRLHIRRLSPGCIYSALLALPGQRDGLGMSSEDWIKSHGADVIDFSRGFPQLTHVHEGGPRDTGELGATSDSTPSVHTSS